jgi:hypothetical protein
MNFCDKGERTIEKDWIRTTAGVIYGNSAFGKKNRV